ncbi:hypothetical protein CRG98_041188 [Punica granatum]|uniref:Uncharacterized protein n=1 Tax=Punica granatum TaxID=22663 RepID=A0A2I0I352_PUNGR|nr:hypothetical protein CRG98_041188 [Punica granatum]
METWYRVAGGVELKLDESVCPRPSRRRHRCGGGDRKDCGGGARRVQWGEEIGRTSGSMEVRWVDLILVADGGREGIESGQNKSDWGCHPAVAPLDGVPVGPKCLQRP